MNIQQCNWFTKTLAIPFLLGFTAPGLAEIMSPLDTDGHPDSPQYTSVYSEAPLPLDTRLSWTERFNGDETFNADEALPRSGSALPASHEMLMAMDSASMPAMVMDGMGVIKGLRPSQGKVKLSHGPIEKYGMPAMTMMFKVDDPSQLEGLEKGQQVGFNVDNSSGGFVLTHIMSMPAEGMNKSNDMSAGMDARGEVEMIRASQGKVKIKHGPIDKYGMPAMTMMFKVADPALLGKLKKGSTIDFDIDNSSGGFVITDIVTVEE